MFKKRWEGSCRPLAGNPMIFGHVHLVAGQWPALP